MSIRVLGAYVGCAMLLLAGCGVEFVPMPPARGAKGAKRPSTNTEARSGPKRPARPLDDFDIREADLFIHRLDSEGLVTTNIQCVRDGAGALGPLSILLVTGWMVPYKESLDLCAPAGEEVKTRVRWRASQGVITEIVARGKTKEVKACVERTLHPGEPLFEGRCVATVRHGNQTP